MIIIIGNYCMGQFLFDSFKTKNNFLFNLRYSNRQKFISKEYTQILRIQVISKLLNNDFLLLILMIDFFPLKYNPWLRSWFYHNFLILIWWWFLLMLLFFWKLLVKFSLLICCHLLLLTFRRCLQGLPIGDCFWF